MMATTENQMDSILDTIRKIINYHEPRNEMPISLSFETQELMLEVLGQLSPDEREWIEIKGVCNFQIDTIPKP